MNQAALDRAVRRFGFLLSVWRNEPATPYAWELLRTTAPAVVAEYWQVIHKEARPCTSR